MPALTTAILAATLIQTPPTPDLGWMAGYWRDCSNGREVSETWSDSRAGLVVGSVVTVSASGRPSFEASYIVAGPDGLTYFAQPNGAPPTPFVLIDSGTTRAVFSNPENDFPHRILYEREGDTLKARIEGVIEGQARSMEWTFEAAPLNSRCPR
ncbi:DUF6265 family protein [Brevundimonas sp.]